MGHSEHKQQLITQARRRAFETYLRFGRMPNTDTPPAERKAINPAIPLPAPLPQHATRFYVWRTREDDRVRPSHAMRHGQIFSRNDPPRGGPPRTEPNCRCWAEPYYGDPSIPDALQPLDHQQQISTDPATHWASIETLTRPDGSLAQSAVVTPDGMTISSLFQATSIKRTVVLADGQTVRVDTESGLQSVYLGTDSTPLFQSRWTGTGPKVIRARQHVAFLLDRGQLDDDLRPRPRELDLTGGGGGGGDLGLGAIALALTSIFRIQQAAPASQGLGEGDEPVLAVTAWTVDGQGRPFAILVGSLTEEQLRQSCRFLPDVQNWTDDAAALLADQKPILPARTWGSLVHGAIKRTIDSLKASVPFIYDSLYPEFPSPLISGGKYPMAKKAALGLMSWRIERLTWEQSATTMSKLVETA